MFVRYLVSGFRLPSVLAEVLTEVGTVPGRHGSAYICKGPLAQSAALPWAQEACQIAGVDPDQRVQVVYKSDVIAVED